MKKDKKLLFAFAVLMPLFAVAKDATVIFRVDETNAKIVRYTPVIVNSEDFSPIAKAELNEADSVFVFRDFQAVGQPAVIYEIDGDYQGQTLSQTSDTTTIYIPAFYLKDPEMLKELTVTASDRRMSAEKDTYIPTSSVKRISADGLSLLQNIGIPTISVSPIDGTLSSITGQTVSVFIDYQPASRTDVRNIRAEDVKRVDVYESSSDPRFRGAQYVVNFVMTEYEFGGYSKIDADEDFSTISGYSMGAYGAYSKLSYKKMIYDIGVDADYSHSRHNGEMGSYNYRFPKRDVAVERLEEKSLSKNHDITAFVRALYKTDKMVISNLLGIKSGKTPDNFNEAQERFSSDEYVSGTSSYMDNNDSFSFSWDGNYQFALPGNNTLVLNTNASYGTNNRSSIYQASDARIDNFAHEKMWRAQVDASLQKVFGKHSVSANVYVRTRGNDIDYSGTTDYVQHGRTYDAGLWVEGMLKFGQLVLQPSIQAYYNHMSINSYRENHIFPKYNIYGTYMIDSKNRITFVSSFTQMGTGQSVRMGEVLYQNQIDAIAGSPELKTMDYIYDHVVYTFMPAPIFSAAIFGKYVRVNRPTGYNFIPAERNGRDMMLRQYTNGKYEDDLLYGISANAFLFDRKLSLQMDLCGSTQHARGVFNHSDTHLMFNINARYNISDFYIGAFYQHKYDNVSSAGIRQMPAYYYLSAGWGNGDWQIRALASNPFSKSRNAVRTIIEAPDFSSDVLQRSMVYHCRFNLSVTYSFSYGKKKVNAGESVSAPSGVESQMLK